jgi:hypothetical protein
MPRPKKLSPSKQWMIDHPCDKPCPMDPDSARAWRIKRGLELSPAQAWKAQQDQRRYEEAMREKRAAQAAAAHTSGANQ